MTEMFLIFLAVAAIVAAAVVFVLYSGCRKRLEDLSSSLDDSAAENASRMERILSLEKENSSLRARIAGQDDMAARMQQLHDRTVENIKEQHLRDMDLMRDQFKATAAEIAAKNTQEFKEQSAGRLSDILNPIKEKFTEFSRSVDDSRTASVAMKTSLEEQIRNLMDQSGKVGEEARNLANALTSRSKVQGDFGELILKDILVNAGLMEGVHFICQGVITDTDGHEVKSIDGRTLIPDVLVFYPDDTMVIVDSKVSLTGYASYMSANDDAQREQFVRQHIESIRKHVNELADKNYASYVPDDKKKVDYNIMFIPNEGAFQMMLERAPRMWQEAKDRNVLVVSQMTLVIVLNMIQMVWKQAERERNIEEIHRTASELMTQLQSWLASYAAVGEQIEKVAKSYSESRRKLVDSNQSVIQKIRKLERQGLAPKKTAVKSSSRKSGAESVIPPSLSGEDVQ
ncbi:MAG: DNA recombination protein RmuC [Clostridium sp.]|nr:DNA recombination protein RmuC [Bacteroides sp.]MCM1198051.1 DNA recombination protein RmuC [Clostridium sp.]